jgi:plasmid stability protein
MHQLLVRNLDTKVVAALKARAAKHGRSTEAEHRAILERALLSAPPEQDFKAFLRSAPSAPGLRLTRSKDRGRRVSL